MRGAGRRTEIVVEALALCLRTSSYEMHRPIIAQKSSLLMKVFWIAKCIDEIVGYIRGVLGGINIWCHAGRILQVFLNCTPDEGGCLVAGEKSC